MYALTSLFLLATLAFPLQAQKQADSSSYYYQIIIDQQDSDKMVAAIAFYEKQLAAYEAKGDLMSCVQGLRLTAVAQYHLGYLFECEASATKGLAYLEQLPKTETTQEAEKALYIQLGRVYRTLENTSTSIYYYEKALALATTTRDSIININNIANVHSDAKAYALAETELALAYQLTLKQKDGLTMAKAQDNLGFVQSKLGKPQGIVNMEEALVLRLQETDLTGIYSSYRHLCEYYLDRDDYAQATEYAQKAYEVAVTLNSASYLDNALTNLLKSKNDPLFTQYIALTDSLSKAQLVKENKYAGIKFNFEMEARRANANQLEKEKAKRRTLLYQGLGGFVVLSGIFLFFLLRNKHRKEKLLEIYHTETRISKKVHDEVANDVYHVMTKLQNTPTQDEAILDDLEHIYTKTRDISKESGAIDVHEHFDSLLTDLLLSYKSPEVAIITRNIGKIDWDAIPDTKKTTLYRVLQELMTNMRKHSQATLVAIVCSMKGRKVQIEYTDNGVGTDLQKKGGLLNTENRMETINGHISFESAPNKGFKATITL